MKTEKVYIQHLMEKFMDNATSVDEERVLKEYFSTHDDIPEDWNAYAILFRGFSQKSSVANKKRRLVYPWVAAVAASVVCVFLLYVNDNSQDELAVTEVGCDTVKTQMSPQEIKEDNTKLLATSVDIKKQSAVKKQSVTLRHQLADNLEVLASDEIDELSDEQIMQEYIAYNFMRLDERMLIEESGEIITMCQNSQSEHFEYLNGLGQMVNIEDYDF
jgi:hypothetical protein